MKAVPDLLEALEGQRGQQIKTLPERLTTTKIPELLVWFQTQTNPLALWFIHMELDRRNIPPCLRTVEPHAVYHDETRQNRCITWLADMHWLAQRYPKHATQYTRWRHLFLYEPDSEKWHGLATSIFMNAHGQHKGHYFSQGLALTDKMRQPLAEMTTQRMRDDRRILAGIGRHREALLQHAQAHRDRAGKITPAELTQKRTELLRLYLLAGRSKATAAAWYNLVHDGATMTRQAVANNIDTVERISGLNLKKKARTR